MIKRGSLSISVVTVFLLTAGASAASGTPEASSNDAEQLEEIVVTAQRREESLQSVPISVTALTSQALETQQVIDVLSLAKVVPSMQAKPTLSPFETTVAIRGITQLIPSINVDPSIGTYVDGVYNVLNDGSNTAMIDMERAEVLKGPQGTLFGRNTIGGALNITTGKPTDDLGGYVETGYGNYHAWTTTGVLNAPIDPGVLDTRLVYQHTEHDGYGRDLTTGSPTGTLTQDYLRGTVDFKPSDRLDAMLVGFYTHADGFGFPSNLAYISPTASLAPGILPPTNVLIPALSGHPGDLLSNYVVPNGTFNTYGGRDDRYSFQQFGFTGTVSGRLNDTTSIKSITGYINTSNNYSIVLGGTPYDIVNLNAYPLQASQFSEELQLYGDALQSRLRWITGLYYFGVTGSQVSVVEALPALTAPAPPTLNPTGPYVNNKSYSAFGQLTYEVLTGVRLTGGARFVEDTRDAIYHDSFTTLADAFVACDLASAPGDPNFADCKFNDSVKYHYVPWTVGIDYKPTSDTLLYAKVSQGFRSGAFGLNGPPAVLPSATVTLAQAAMGNAANLAAFAPVAYERLLSPEIGGKFELLDHRLRVNAAAFSSEYSNIQLTVDLPASCPTCVPDAVLENSGKARIFGAELELAALLGKLQLDAGIGYANPKYTSGPDVGQPIINVSKANGSVTASYPIGVRAGTLDLSSTYSYRSSAVFYALSPGLAQSVLAYNTQPGFGLLDAIAAFKLASLPMTLSLYAQNLADRKYIVSADNFAPPLAFAATSPGVPRTYGATVRYTF